MFMHKNTMRGTIAKEVIAFKERWDRKRGTDIGNRESFIRYSQSLKASIIIMSVLCGVYFITAITDFNEIYQKLDKEGYIAVTAIMGLIIYTIVRDIQKLKITQFIIENDEDEKVLNDYKINQVSE